MDYYILCLDAGTQKILSKQTTFPLQVSNIKYFHKMTMDSVSTGRLISTDDWKKEKVLINKKL